MEIKRLRNLATQSKIKTLKKKKKNITFTDNDIAKIIKGLDPNKALSHDLTSIGMLTLCEILFTYLQNFTS